MHKQNCVSKTTCHGQLSQRFKCYLTMAKLNVYNFITLNGYYKGRNEDISWHRHGKEEADFSREGLGTENILVFGRVTYQMMAGFWPTPAAMEQLPDIAKSMNDAEKIV